MTTLYEITRRTVSDRTFNANKINLSRLVTVSNIDDIRVRFEIFSLSNGAHVSFTYSMYNSDVYMGGATNNYSNIGKHEIGFGRGDFNDNTDISVSVDIVGTVEIGITVYSVENGEEVEAWQ